MADTMRRGVVFALVLLVGALGSSAGPIESIRPSLGVIFIVNRDSSAGTGTTDLITNVMGSGIVMPFRSGSSWSFEPSADFYWAYYEYSAGGRALPTDVATRDAFVVGFLVETPVVFKVPLNDTFTLGMGAGLATNLRFGFSAASEVPAKTVDRINHFFWEEGRFFDLTTLLRIEYRLTERVDFGFTARAFWPVYNLWIKEAGMPFLDQGIFGGVLLVRYRL